MDRFKARYAELRADILSADNIVDVYERLTDVITTYDGLLEEDYASTTGGGAFTSMPYKTENNIQQIRNFVAARLPYMDEQVEAIAPPAEQIPCTGITLDQTTLTFDGAGTQTLTATVTPSDTTDMVVWSTDANTVATVSGGVVTAVGNGSATITATCGAYSATCTVSVSGIDVDGSILYQLEQPTTLTGTSGINTSVKLWENDIDFTVALDFTPNGGSSNEPQLFACHSSISPWYGFNAQAKTETYNGNYRLELGLTSINWPTLDLGIHKDSNQRSYVVVRHTTGSGEYHCTAYNGTETISGVLNGSFASGGNGNPLWIGIGDPWSTPKNYFKGIFHRAIVYSRVLSDTEVNEFMGV